MQSWHRIRNVRRYWPAAPLHFERPRCVDLGRATAKTNSFVVKNGLSFQRRVTNYFSALPDWYALPELEIQYLCDGQISRAFVDLALINPFEGWILVLECKRTHTPDSYKQIWKYLALLASRFGAVQWKFAGFEVCSLSGRCLEYPGESQWMSGPAVRLKDVEWDGQAAPKVGILPWYINDKWSFIYG